MDELLLSCLDVAKSYLNSTQESYQVTALYDLGDAYLFAWEPGESIKASDNFSIEVNKDTKQVSLFILPDERNFNRLKSAIEILYK